MKSVRSHENWLGVLGMARERIVFSRDRKTAVFYDPRLGFQRSEVECEIRKDPLTGATSRIAHLGAATLAKPDFSLFVSEDAQLMCPFCPPNLDKVTPKFPDWICPEGRLSYGEATVVPNLLPYDAHSAVVIMGPQHFVGLEQFTVELLVNAFQAAVQYAQRVRKVCSDLPYTLLAWNYMPPSGGTQVHPHLQTFVTSYPGNQYCQEQAASQQYYDRWGCSYWADLLRAEKEAGERYLGATGTVQWLSAFAPMGMAGDILIVFPNKYSLFDLTSDDWTDFAHGLVRVFKYFQATSVYSFNLAFYPGTEGQQYFWVHARMTPRFPLHPVLNAPDVNVIQLLYREGLAICTPEVLAGELRPYFQGQDG